MELPKSPGLGGISIFAGGMFRQWIENTEPRESSRLSLPIVGILRCS